VKTEKEGFRKSIKDKKGAKGKGFWGENPKKKDKSHEGEDKVGRLVKMTHAGAKTRGRGVPSKGRKPTTAPKKKEGKKLPKESPEKEKKREKKFFLEKKRYGMKEREIGVFRKREDFIGNDRAPGGEYLLRKKKTAPQKGRQGDTKICGKGGSERTRNERIPNGRGGGEQGKSNSKTEGKKNKEDTKRKL